MYFRNIINLRGHDFIRFAVLIIVKSFHFIKLCCNFTFFQFFTCLIKPFNSFRIFNKSCRAQNLVNVLLRDKNLVIDKFLWDIRARSNIGGMCFQTHSAPLPPARRSASTGLPLAYTSCAPVPYGGKPALPDGTDSVLQDWSHHQQSIKPVKLD
jgi:hypothetical protein